MRYYVYELVVTPDQSVCYVGKGSGKRAFEHRKRASLPKCRTGYQKRLYSKLRSLLDSGKDFYARIVYETDDEIDALKIEQKLIAIHGFENLFNVASHAFLGRSLKLEVCKTISDRIKNAWKAGKYANRAPRRNFGRKPMRCGWFPKNHRDSKYRGVSRWSDRGRPGVAPRWTARITENGKSKLLCNTLNLKKALKAYDNAAERLHGIRPNGTKP